jgi:hypothetical protein
LRQERALKVVLVLVGLLFTAGGGYILTTSLWRANQSEYTFDMMLSLYVTLGIFLLLAVRNPSAYRSLIAFAAWSSFAHGTVMVIMSFRDVSERGGLLGASAFFVILGVALIVLAPAKPPGERASAAG